MDILIPLIGSVAIFLFIFSLLKLSKSLKRSLDLEKSINKLISLFSRTVDVKNRSRSRIAYILSFFAMSLLSYFIFKNILFSLIVSACAFLTFIGFIKDLGYKRKSVLARQLIRLIDDISIMVSSGKTLRQVFQEIPEYSEKPLRPYLFKISNRLASGLSLEDALSAFSKQARSKDIDLLVESLKVNLRLGGDLKFILQNVTNSIRQDLKRKSKGSTSTLQSRYSGNLIAIMPIFILSVIYVLFNDTVQPFFNSRIGNIFLAIGGTLQVAGILSIKKVISISK